MNGQFESVNVTRSRVPSDDLEYGISEGIRERGHNTGIHKYGEEKWNKMIYPSQTNLRIWTPPTFDNGNLSLGVIPYEWASLQQHKQMQPVADEIVRDNFQVVVAANAGDPKTAVVNIINKPLANNDPLKYVYNAVALTANALPVTRDGQLVFHNKKGGAAPGSIHTLGGYVSHADLSGDYTIQSAIKRELGERDEIQLTPDTYEITGLFGTPANHPSTLWGFGTSAVYAQIMLKMNAKELQEHMNSLIASGGARESLSSKLHFVPVDKVSDLEAEFAKGEDSMYHPQTRQVLPTIVEMYK